MVSLDVTYDIGYRKANGIYYTPEVIVDYMVSETVGRLVEGKCPEEINGISIVDPACGDGNFLVGVYKYLVEYHKKWYDLKEKIKVLEKIIDDEFYKYYELTDDEIKIM